MAAFATGRTIFFFTGSGDAELSLPDSDDEDEASSSPEALEGDSELADGAGEGRRAAAFCLPLAAADLAIV